VNRQQVIEADLTWTGRRFERGVRVALDDTGRIEAVGALPDRDVTRRFPDRALLPGFVNAHSHAFQRALRGRGETFPAGAGSFWSWREAMYGLVDDLTPERVREVSALAFREMRRAGITTVGEFHYLHHADRQAQDFRLDEAVLEAAREVGIRLALLETYYASSGFGQPPEGAQRRFACPSPDRYWRQMDRLQGMLEPSTQTLGAVAHSIRAATPDEIAELWREAVTRDLPFHMHVEEQRQEFEQCVATYGAAPTRLLLDRLDLDERFSGVHMTHTAPEDLKSFASTGAHALICPTTEANLGDGIFDLPLWLSAGGATCLGSDSNAVISMVEEARWLELVQRLARERRGVARDASDPRGPVAPVLFAAATVGGARSLRVDAGEIRPGAWGDFQVLDLAAMELEGWQDETLMESYLLGAGNGAIAETAVGGWWHPIE
jgi:formimidoylglutamate deiminase